MFRRIAAAALHRPRVSPASTAPSAQLRPLVSPTSTAPSAVAADDRRRNASSWTVNTGAHSAANIGAVANWGSAAATAAAAANANAGANIAATTADTAANRFPKPPPRPDSLPPGVPAVAITYDLIAKLDDALAKVGGVPGGLSTQVLAQILENHRIACLVAAQESFRAESEKVAAAQENFQAETEKKKKNSLPNVATRFWFFADVLNAICSGLIVFTVAYAYLFPVKARAKADDLVSGLINSGWYYFSWGVVGETLEAKYLREQDLKKRAKEAKKIAEDEMSKRLEVERWARIFEQRRLAAARKLKNIELLRYGLVNGERLEQLKMRKPVRGCSHMFDLDNYRGTSMGMKEWLATSRKY